MEQLKRMKMKVIIDRPPFLCLSVGPELLHV